MSTEPTPPKVDRDDRPVLPTATRDDTDEGWGEHRDHREHRRADDDRLLADRPPHWGSD